MYFFNLFNVKVVPNLPESFKNSTKNAYIIFTQISSC